MGFISRFSQNAVVGGYGRAYASAATGTVTLDGQATDGTTVVAWSILAWVRTDLATPSDPAVPLEVAAGTDGVPTYAFAPPAVGHAHIYEIRTWSVANPTEVDEATSDIREIATPQAATGVIVPAPIVDTTLQRRIVAQYAAGLQLPNNYNGWAWGWGGPAGGAGYARLIAEAEALRTEVTALSALVAANAELLEPVATVWSSPVLTLDRSRAFVYDGADESVELSGFGPHRVGASFSIVFPAGTITGNNVVTLADSIGPLNAQRTGVEFDPVLDYRVMVYAIGEYELVARAGAEVARDLVNPAIQSATVSNSNPNAIVVAFSETVANTDENGFSCAGHPITGVSGTGASRTFLSSAAFVVDEVASLVWDGTNNFTDGSNNPLEAGSISITNNVGYPTIVSAAVVDATLTVTYSENINGTNADGHLLTGTSAVFSSLTDVTDNVATFTLDQSVVAGETIFLEVTAANTITSVSTSLALQPTQNVSVTNNTAGGEVILWQDTFDRADVSPIDNNWAYGANPAALVSNAMQLNAGNNGFEETSNPTDVTLPADHRVRITVEHALTDGTGTFFGFVGRNNNGDSTGVAVFWLSGAFGVGVPQISNRGDLFGANQTVVTNGYPASLGSDQDHTIELNISGTTATLYIDGQEYGYATISDNVGVTGLGVNIIGEQRSRRILDVTVLEAL